MKRTFFYLLLVGALALGACKKFLTTSPADTVTTATYYQNATQLNTAVTTIYNKLISYGYGKPVRP